MPTAIEVTYDAFQFPKTCAACDEPTETATVLSINLATGKFSGKRVDLRLPVPLCNKCKLARNLRLLASFIVISLGLGVGFLVGGRLGQADPDPKVSLEELTAFCITFIIILILFGVLTSLIARRYSPRLFLVAPRLVWTDDHRKVLLIIFDDQWAERVLGGGKRVSSEPHHIIHIMNEVFWPFMDFSGLSRLSDKRRWMNN